MNMLCFEFVNEEITGSKKFKVLIYLSQQEVLADGTTI